MISTTADRNDRSLKNEISNKKEKKKINDNNKSVLEVGPVSTKRI